MKIKKLFTWANLLLILAILIYPTYYIAWKYPLERDVWGILDRAQISAESDDMLRLVNIAVNNIENKRSLFSGYPQTKGYCALIFQKPENSLEMQYTAMLNIRKRLERTDTFDKNDVEYQTAIDDIRGTIRELPYIDCWIWHFK